MRRAGAYCLVAILAPMIILAGMVNPGGTGSINRTATIQTGRQFSANALRLAASGASNFSGRSVSSSPQLPIPPQVGLETYSLQPNHDFGFSGTGFSSGEQVEVLLGSPDVVPSPRSGMLLARSYTNPGGTFAGRAFVPLMPPGDYPLLFVGLRSKMPVIVNLNIRGFNPWVTLSNYAPSPHSMIGFSGQDFAPGEPVLVYLNQQRSKPVAHLQADSTGQFITQQDWEVPDLSGQNTLTFVGSYSGAAATATFKPLKPASPGSLFFYEERASLSPVSNIQDALAQRNMARLPVHLSAIGDLGATLSSFLQDPLHIAVLFLGLWITLCVFLTLPLIIPRRREQHFKHKPGGVCSPLSERIPRSENSGKGREERAPNLSGNPSLPSHGLLLEQDSELEQPANFCPWCGLHNSTRSSQCTGCQRTLPQLPSQGTRTAQPSLSYPPTGLCEAPPSLLSPPAITLRPEKSLEPSRATAQAHQHDRAPVSLPMPLALGLHVSAKSDRGRKRAEQENEDDFLVVTGTRWAYGTIQPFGLFVVADGMGGHDDGHIASHLTIETIFRDLIPMLIRKEIPGESLLHVLEGAIQNANWRLYMQNEQEHTNMGTTVTAALVTGREAAICNVGDSRVYVINGQSPLHRITVDHSLVESLVVAEIIQREDVYTHPKRNLIFRCVGQRQRVQIDTFRQPIETGDRLLLCSDGLWEMVHDHEIARTLHQFQDTNQASEKLVELANEHGGLDNITTILVDIVDHVQLTDRPMIQVIKAHSFSADQALNGVPLF